MKLADALSKHEPFKCPDHPTYKGIRATARICVWCRQVRLAYLTKEKV